MKNKPTEPFDGEAVTAFYRQIGKGNLAAAHDAVVRVWNDDVRHALYGEMRLRAVEWGNLTYAHIAAQFSCGQLDRLEAARCRDSAVKNSRTEDALACAAYLGESFSGTILAKLSELAASSRPKEDIVARALRVAADPRHERAAQILATVLIEAQGRSLSHAEDTALGYAVEAFENQHLAISAR